MPWTKPRFNAFDEHWRDDAAALSAYDRHAEAVRRAVDPNRFVEWQPGDGWQPICAALGVPMPDEPFPRVNSAADFLARTHNDQREESP